MKNVMLYTFSNVKTAANTKCTFSNPTPDIGSIKRSQEFYDAVNRDGRVRYWACGRYGQREYSAAEGKKYGDKMQGFVDEILAAGDHIDYSIQMSGHPNIAHRYPYYISTDFMPYMDISMLDDTPMPRIGTNTAHEQCALYQKASGVICFAPLLRQFAIDYYELNPAKITSICSGITGFVDEDTVKKHKKYILWFGMDYKRKDGETLVRAFETVRKRHPDYHLVLAGSSVQVEAPNVHCMPFINDDSVIDSLYRDAAIFAMTSCRENLGLVYLEAMARKTPVIATTRGGMAQMLRKSDSGMVCPPVAPDALASYICSLIEDQALYEKYSRRGYMFAKLNAQWTTYIERMDDAIQCWQEDEPVPADYNIYDF